jgi:integrase
MKPHLEAYALTHREKSVLFATGRLAHVTRVLGTTLLPDLTESAVPGYVRTRLLLTGMRSGEITALTWGQVDFERRVLTVGKAKPASGAGRQIAMTSELFGVLSIHPQWFTSRFGEAAPFGKPTPDHPTRCITGISAARDAFKREGGLSSA